MYMAEEMLGLPKVKARRWNQVLKSLEAAPPGEARWKSTASAPEASRISSSFSAIASRVSSQVIRSQPGSGEVFGFVRRTGCFRRSG